MPSGLNKPDIVFTFGKVSIMVDIKTAKRIKMKLKARKQRDKKFAKQIRAKLRTL